MLNWFQGTSEVVTALLSADSWQISQVMGQPAVWPLGLLAMIIAAGLILTVYRLNPWTERSLEPTVMVVSYLAIGAIIFVEVFRRFVLQQQAPWSTTLPPFLFLIMTWFGCSYNVKLRTHLAFIEFRSAMPRIGQFSCLVLDAALWIGFSWVVFVTSMRVVANSAANFQIMLGTDNVMQWWFLLAVPLSFTSLVARVFENLITDIARFKRGDELIQPAVIGGD
jgi:TRAP-type C4-dicarboxylate transport system permease small subunit